MSTISQSLTAKLKVNTADFKRGLGRANDQAKRAGQQMRASFKSAALAFAAVGVAGLLAARKVISAVKSVVGAFAIQQEAEIGLQAALKATGKVGDDAFSLITKKAAELQKVTTKGDEALIRASSSLALLAPALNAKELANAQEAIVGIADVFLKGDVDSAAQLLGKSLGSTTNALTRYGIQVDTSATQSEKLRQILAQTGTFFETSKAKAGSLTGQIAQLSNAWGDVKEKLGAFLATSPLVKSALEQTKDLVTEIGTILTGSPQQIKAASEALGQLIGAGIAFGLGKALETTFRLANPLAKLPGIIGEGFDSINLAAVAAGKLSEAAQKSAADALAAIGAIAKAAEATQELVTETDRIAPAVDLVTPALQKVRRGFEEIPVLKLKQGLEGAVRAGQLFANQIIAATSRTEDLARAEEKVRQIVRRVTDTLASQTSRAVTDLISGFRSVNDIVKNIGRSIISNIIEQLAKAALKATGLASKIAGIASGGGLLGGILGGVFGGLFKRGGMVSAARGLVLPQVATASNINNFGGGIPILAHPGEAVLNRGAVQTLGGSAAVEKANTAGRGIVNGADQVDGRMSVHIGSLSFPGISDMASLRRQLPGILRDLRSQGAIA